MVHLNRIYTKSGDGGETGLGDGQRVRKTHPRIAAYGGVDELNAVIGVAVAAGMPDEIASRLQHVQNDLFDLGADLCVPERAPSDAGPSDAAMPERPPLRMVPAQAVTLERWIDDATSRLQPLTSFVLPGGALAAAHLHHARTVCRRVEIGVLALAEQEPVNPQVAIYLNRLSDLLFVLARLINDDAHGDILWTPGRHRSG